MTEESLSARILRLAKERPPRAKRVDTYPVFAYQAAKEELSVWRGMIARCHNPRSEAYLYYGAIGVSVFWPWFKDFEIFLAYVGPRPSLRHSIDRWPNPAGNYEPGNVRWATPEQQRSNRRPRPHRYSREKPAERIARVKAWIEWENNLRKM